MNSIFTARIAKYLKANGHRVLVIALSAVMMLGTLGANAFGAPPPLISPYFRVHLLDPSFDPNTPVGGVPFCTSGSLGTILCYPPSFLKKAYNFPPTSGNGALDGSGQTIVIVDAFGSPTLKDDLNKFNSTFGLPPAKMETLCGPTWSGAETDSCPVKTIADLSNAPNAALCGAAGWAEETTLDVTMSHALAPGAKIVLVVANDCLDPSINAAERAIVDNEKFRGSVMSQSFGEPDDMVGCQNFPCTVIDPTVKATADSTYEKAVQNAWTVIASSADDGANEALRAVGTIELTPAWPSTNPFNLAAGGTQGNPYGGQFGPPPGPGQLFSCPANTMCNTGLVVISGGPNGCGTAARPGVPSSCVPVAYGGEAAWNEFNVFGVGTSTGGGISSQYRRPEYQEDLPNTFVTLFGHAAPAHGRLNPDVSFNSQIHGGVLAYLSFLTPARWAVFGGTSAASPAWAAIIALLNQANGGPVGFITPAIYDLNNGQTKKLFNQITSGNNSDTDGQIGVDGFTATPGYNLTNGQGSPDVSDFIKVMARGGN